MFTLNGQRIPYDKAWTHPDTGVQYPANWMRLASLEEKESIGLVEEADPSITSWDQRFYWGVDNPKQLDDVTDDDGNTTTGLKTLWKNKQNETAASLLAPSDWRVVKELEVNSSFSAAKTAFPTEWQTYRAAVRTACNTRQGEIDACADVAALKELLFGSAQINQTDSDGNVVMIDNPNLATAWPDPID